PAAAAPETPAAPVTITVQPGYSLWKIARENLGEGVLYVQVFEANKDQIKNPDLIYPGQVFTLPKE
ncbi:MAG: LysM peptidoglycan-binding domain-containing protein, partial [Rhodobacteraceae bacterium]|nr:LysM peptidoglycan-binding domain-containing protein [Paracoccaceae bacterium]